MVGQRLKAFREERGYSAYRVAKDGEIRIDQVNAVENGENCTLDTFFGYIRGCGLYMYFAEKSEGHKQPHDFKELIDKGISEDPLH